MITPVCQALELNDEVTLDMTFSLLSQYRSRGISQTQNDPAMQFDGMLSSKSSGLYMGIWTSSVDYGYDSKVRQELDYYAGWYVPFSEAVSLDLGYIKYSYTRGNEANASETYATLTAYGLKAGAQYAENMRTSNKGQSTLYTWVGYDTALPYALKLATRFGEMDYKDPIFVSSSGSVRNSYREWEAKLTKDYLGASWAISYIDTDLSNSECINAFSYGDVCTATAVASVSKKF